MSDADRLVLEVSIIENTREEDAQAFEQYITDMFVSVYDEITVTASAEGEQR